MKGLACVECQRPAVCTVTNGAERKTVCTTHKAKALKAGWRMSRT